MKQYESDDGLVLVTVFEAGTMMVATRPDTSYSFGPPIVVRPVEVAA